MTIERYEHIGFSELKAFRTDETDVDASTIFDSDGMVIAKLSLASGVTICAKLDIVRDDVRELMEGHSVAFFDCRDESINPKSLIGQTCPSDGGLTVRFDDESHPAFWAELRLAFNQRVITQEVAELPEAVQLRKLGDTTFIRRTKSWPLRPFMPLAHRQLREAGIPSPGLLTESYIEQPIVFPISLYDTPQYGGRLSAHEIMRSGLRYSSLGRMLDDWQVD